MSTQIPLIEGFQNSAANSPQIAYTASEDTVITAFSAVNNTGINRSYRAYIYDSAGNTTGAVRPLKFVTSNRGYDLAPSLLGQIVRKGGTIRVESSAANSLVFWSAGILLG